MHLRLAVLLCFCHARRSRRDERFAQQPTIVGSAKNDAAEQLRLSTLAIDSLNLTLAPPEQSQDEVQSKGQADHEDDDGAELLRNLTRGWEKRRELKLARQGIRYDATTAQYKTPLGLPCDPRDHPVLCQKDEGESTTTTRLPVGVKLRRRRKEIAEETAGEYGVTRKAAEYNPFVDGPMVDASDAPTDSDDEGDFIEEEVFSPGRRRRRAEW